ncbi:DUF305 domain-containing protein [Spirulina subsalsa FACHB-351]|uniref:DUF305 domain-containing protein n=1 Tax=Spirulina subsalsa FACHB-351 TaxID=234711 RepID=A0ABT3L9T7_9CYAN|nr:DUF305 domain-containing protein [Spirulina subsalsa]MCW6038261.1 DUF305 domain-containing protein [Spirulina subsalsa FACHB-351]
MVFQLNRLFLSSLAIAGLITACSSPPTSVEETPSQQTAMEEHSGMKEETINHADMDHAQVDLGPADEAYDLRFIDAMIPHHEGAVVMAQEVLAQSQKPELLALATEIIEAQTEEIAQMQEWRETWYPDAPETPMAWDTTTNEMMPMSAEQMSAMRMDMDLGAADEDFEKRFLKAMIPHHEGALMMAEDLKAKSERPEMQLFAQGIIDSQAAEIGQMRQWLKEWYDKE